MADKLTETVTITREIDPRIADLVRFGRVARALRITFGERDVTDAELIAAAQAFWEAQHGDD
jgi:hypothetical protein